MILLWLRALISYTTMAIFSIIFFIPCLILVLILPEEQRYTNKLIFILMAIIYKCALWCSMATVHIRGKEKIPNTPVIIVANHESALDIPLLGALLNSRPHIWYAYYTFFNLPVVGLFLRRMAIPVYADGLLRSARAIACGICRAKKYGLSSVLFPEGGRYVDGEIHDFFAGFAMIAKKLNQPVVPVIIRNAGRIYPPHCLLLYPGSIDIEIGDPLTMSQDETNVQFADRVQEWFVQHNNIVS